MLKNSRNKISLGIAKPGLIMMLAMLMYGCSGLTKSDIAAVTNWWLEPLKGSGSQNTVGLDNDEAINVLVLVTVVPGLDTANILNLSPSAELSYYTGARWADEVPELMTSLVGRSLELNGKYQVVNRRNSRNLDRCVLRINLNAFYAELNQSGGTEDIHIAYTGEYRCDGVPSRYLKFDSRTPVGADRMSAIVASYQKGLDASLGYLLSQIK